MKRTWEKWKKVAAIVGDFQASVLFSILYFLIVTPTAILTSFFYNFLNIESYPQWQKITHKIDNLKDLKKQ